MYYVLESMSGTTNVCSMCVNLCMTGTCKLTHARRKNPMDDLTRVIIPLYMCIYMYIYIHTYHSTILYYTICTYVPTYMQCHACMHTCMHACMQAHIHCMACHWHGTAWQKNKLADRYDQTVRWYEQGFIVICVIFESGTEQPL